VRGRGKGLGAPRRGPTASERASHLFTADAHALPLRDGRLRCRMIAFGARNLADVRAAAARWSASLRPGGQLLVLEFFRADPAAAAAPRPVAAAALVARRHLPLLGRLFAGDGSAYGYLPPAWAASSP